MSSVSLENNSSEYLLRYFPKFSCYQYNGPIRMLNVVLIFTYYRNISLCLNKDNKITFKISCRLLISSFNYNCMDLDNRLIAYLEIKVLNKISAE